MSSIVEMKIVGAPAGAPTFDVEVADTFVARFLGLMGRRPLPPRRALLLSPCSSVHMCFMRFAIDVVYIDSYMRIIKIVRDLRPWTGVSFCAGAKAALELSAGGADELGLSVGMVLQMK